MRKIFLNENERAYKNMLKKSVKEYNSINDEKTNADISMIINKSCSYGAFSWQKELIVEMKIYITYLGFIEALLIEAQEYMDEYKEYNDCQKYKECEEKYYFYEEQREKLIKIIKSQTRLGNDTTFEIVTEVLEYMPVKDGFKVLRSDMRTHKYQLDLQQEFMDAYNAGFMQKDFITYEFVTEKFENSLEAIAKHKNNNKKLVAQIKLKHQA